MRLGDRRGLAHLDKSGWPGTYVAVGSLRKAVGVKLEARQWYSPGSGCRPADRQNGIEFDGAVEVHHKPDDWNLSGSVVGNTGWAAAEANTVSREVARCSQDKTHWKGQDQLRDAEDNHMVDG